MDPQIGGSRCVVKAGWASHCDPVVHGVWQTIRAWLGRRGPAPRGAGSVGGAAERRAAEWLMRECSMVLVARNWRNPEDRREEIDLVLRDGPELVFVEVKARAAAALVPGFHAVGRRKRAVLRRAVSAYLRGCRVRPALARFDIVEVETADHRPADTWAVQHFRGVFLFPANVRR